MWKKEKLLRKNVIVPKYLALRTSLENEDLESVTKKQYSNHGNSPAADSTEKFLINAYSCMRKETLKVRLFNFHNILAIIVQLSWFTQNI